MKNYRILLSVLLLSMGSSFYSSGSSVALDEQSDSELDKVLGFNRLKNVEVEYFVKGLASKAGFDCEIQVYTLPNFCIFDAPEKSQETMGIAIEKKLFNKYKSSSVSLCFLLNKMMNDTRVGSREVINSSQFESIKNDDLELVKKAISESEYEWNLAIFTFEGECSVFSQMSYRDSVLSIFITDATLLISYSITEGELKQCLERLAKEVVSLNRRSLLLSALPLIWWFYTVKADGINTVNAFFSVLLPFTHL